MKLNEESLIERIRRRVPSAPGGLLRVGIGDDAAVLHAPAGREWVITCDSFLEDVHFLSEAHPADVVGYKALARATSDIAAMGARPEVFLLDLAIPPARTGRWLDAMLGGMARAAREFGLRLAGGDTSQGSRANPKIALTLTVLGTVKNGRALLRRGARPGDSIFVSGNLGEAQLGLELLLRGMHRDARWKNLLRKQFCPVPAIALGQWLADKRLASGAMDLSDGLSSDLNRLCKASGVGARIHAERLPCVAVPGAPHGLGLSEQTLALHGGEDYGLLFTVPKRAVNHIPPHFRGVALTRIGETTRGRQVTLIAPDGKRTRLEPRGWDHFRTK
jgi:thiamine-monophosphate kinase